MISRKIYGFLHDFFANDKKALLVTGARQIGKTYSVRHVGNQDFKVFIENLKIRRKRKWLKIMKLKHKYHHLQ